MSGSLCCCLLLTPCGVIGHRLQETANCLLVEGRNTSVLLNNLSLHRIQRIANKSSPSQYESDIHTQPLDRRKVGGIRVPRAPFIASLRVPVYAARNC